MNDNMLIFTFGNDRTFIEEVTVQNDDKCSVTSVASFKDGKNSEVIALTICQAT